MATWNDSTNPNGFKTIASSKCCRRVFTFPEGNLQNILNSGHTSPCEPSSRANRFKLRVLDSDSTLLLLICVSTSFRRQWYQLNEVSGGESVPKRLRILQYIVWSQLFYSASFMRNQPVMHFLHLPNFLATFQTFSSIHLKSIVFSKNAPLRSYHCRTS